MPETTQYQQAASVLSLGGIIAYPTEAVFGLGVDPDNEQSLRRLLQIKNRPAEKGLILVAANIEQLKAYVDFGQLSASQLEPILKSWPGAVTWLVPKVAGNNLLSGQFKSIAVRVSAHPAVQQLCLVFGKPIVSTSANFAGQKPASTAAQVKSYFAGQIDYLVSEDLGNSAQPSQIIDALSGKILRV